jgi:spermidine dehydrogenase
VKHRCPHLEKILGLNEPITRREFLDGALVATGSLLFGGGAYPSLAAAQTSGANGEGWTGYSGEGDYKGSAGNTEQVLQNAHAVRDGDYDILRSDVVETGEIYDCVIVGGGFSGLSAGLFFHQKASSNRNCLILDNARIFGGVAKRNEFIVDGHRLYAPQASIHFQRPYPNSLLESVYDAMGLDWSAFKEYQEWRGPSPQMPLSPRPAYSAGGVNSRPQSGFFFGANYGHRPGIWVTDPWGKDLEGTPFPESIRKEMLALAHDRHVVPPLVYDYPGDAVSRVLDSMTMEDYLVRTYGVSRDTVRLMKTHDDASAFGLGPDALSAFLIYEWSKAIPTLERTTGYDMFPGGNSGMIRLIVKTLIPASIDGPRSMETVWKNPINFPALDQPGQRARIRLNSTAVRVEHIGERSKSELVSVTYIKDGHLYRVKARTAVMAGGGWMTKHVVRDLDENRRSAYDQFCYSPYLFVNVAVRNWRFLYNLGISSATWFEGFGSSTQVHRAPRFGVDLPIGPDLPAVLWFEVDFAKPGLPVREQGQLGRMEMLSTSFTEYERQLREQMTDMFAASGFDAKRDIAGIVLNRWGHAFINPPPGFFFGLNGHPAAREALRSGPFGRIAFSHSDLAGAMDHRNAFIESNRAMNQLLDGVLV